MTDVALNVRTGQGTEFLLLDAETGQWLAGALQPTPTAVTLPGLPPNTQVTLPAPICARLADPAWQQSQIQAHRIWPTPETLVPAVVAELTEAAAVDHDLSAALSMFDLGLASERDLRPILDRCSLDGYTIAREVKTLIY